MVVLTTTHQFQMVTRRSAVLRAAAARSRASTARSSCCDRRSSRTKRRARSTLEKTTFHLKDRITIKWRSSQMNNILAQGQHFVKLA